MSSDSDLKFRKLCGELPFLTEFEQGEYGEFDQEELHIEVITEKAALINGAWIPKSQMRTDEDSIYIAGWLCSSIKL